MVDKEVAKELYKQGYSMAEVARELKTSRQRIHQIVKNYKNTGKLNRKDKYRNFGKCNRCTKTAVVLHHKDFDNSNDKINNLEPLCSSCHIETHLDRNYIKRGYESYQNVLNHSPQIIEDYKKLGFVSDVRKKYNIPDKLIVNILKNAGVPV